MARAKRHYIPGQIWHISHQATPSAWGFALRATTPQVDPTSRCHKREFLLKFGDGRMRKNGDILYSLCQQKN